MHNLTLAAILALFPSLLIIAAQRDLTTYTIPNHISIALALCFLPAALACGLGWHAIGVHALVGLACFAAAVAMFALRWMGGGDAKLLAATGLWMGWPATGSFLVMTGIAGGLLAVSLLAVRTDWVRAHVSGSAPSWALRLMEDKGPAPYGVAIACGALFAFPSTDLVAALNGYL